MLDFDQSAVDEREPERVAKPAVHQREHPQMLDQPPSVLEQPPPVLNDVAKPAVDQQPPALDQQLALQEQQLENQQPPVLDQHLQPGLAVHNPALENLHPGFAVHNSANTVHQHADPFAVLQSGAKEEANDQQALDQPLAHDPQALLLAR